MAAIVACGAALFSTPAFADPILTNPGFNANVLPANDDGSTGLVNMGFAVNFFGTNASQLYVNNNGNVSFLSSLFTYTPFDLTGGTGVPIIAAYFADVDTRGSGSGLTHYGTDVVDGHAAFGVNWPMVGYFPDATDKLNNFQLVLIDRSDIAAGDFDIEFNYTQMQWETGSASGGSGGLGGTSAAVGYSAGTGVAGTFDQLPGSLVNGALIDGGPNALISNSNVGIAGRYIFGVREGIVINPPSAVPLPAAAWSGLLLLGSLGARKLIRSRKHA